MTYYVYELVDPRSGEPFYIGKGKGSRIDAHEREAKKGTHSRKCDRIREIWADKLQVEKNILQRFTDEAEAYATEKAIIEEIGLANLTNVIPGGGGVRPPPKRDPARHTLRGLLKVAPSVARAFREYAKHGNLFVLGKHDITEMFLKFVRDLIRDCGRDAFASALGKHGVEVKFQ